LATPRSSRRPARAEETSQRLGEFLFLHRAKVIAAVIALVVLGAAGWFYRRSVDLKHDRAEIAYFRARQAYDSRNYELAATDFRTVMDRYSGTAGGAQAAMALAQLFYETGRPAEGVAVLRNAIGSAPRDLKPEVHALMGAGQENLGQFDEAARAYQQASNESRFPKDALAHRAAAARAFAAAGKTEEALTIWRELEAESTQFLAAEARVRIGELTARPGG
jgi:predicted negative regulator of RcsB-dependent stress response